MQSKLGSNLLAIYTDASSIKNGTGIGVGLAAFNYANNAKETFFQTHNIGKNQIVYNGELEGIALGFKHATTVAKPTQEI